ncbi:hypothetical protein SLA2020_112340 [Shorea laevis]
MAAFRRELVTEILLRLPVKSLLRFRCLSKPSRAEIDGVNFVQNHLKRSVEAKTHQKLIVNNMDYASHSKLYAADFDNGLKNSFLLNTPLKSLHRCTTFVRGSCNGLILFGMLISYQTTELTIWNPFTRRYKKLPPCPVQTLPEYGCFTGFDLGNDSALDDYKVVMISEVWNSNDNDDDGEEDDGDDVYFQTWVLSLKSNSWRRMGDVEDVVYSLMEIFANGALYWENEKKFLGFDLANEKFFYLPKLVDCCGPKAIYHGTLEDFGGNLCNPVIHAERKTIEFYLHVSDKSGEVASGSWRKEFTVEEGEFDFFLPWPLAYSKNVESMLIKKNLGFFGMTLKTKQRIRVEIPGMPRATFCRYHVC